MFKKTDLESLLIKALPNAEISIETEDEVHFFVTIICDSFENIKPLSRQRQVFKALGDRISNGTIHALSLKTFTKKEWQNACANY